MKDFLSELHSPIVQIREVESVRRYKNEFFIEKRQPLSDREKLLALVNTSHNKKQADGRIYSLSSTGEYSSHSVSPYADSFLDNIEEGIKPLVLALKDKGYLSISSCESHGLSFRRYVTLVFPSEQTAEDFLSHFPFPIATNLVHCTEFLNNKIDVDDYGNLSNSRKIEANNNIRHSIEYVNTMFKRPYADAWFLELTITPVIEIKKPWHYITKLPAIIKKKIFTRYLTNRLIKFVKSDKIPRNIY